MFEGYGLGDLLVAWGNVQAELPPIGMRTLSQTLDKQASSWVVLDLLFESAAWIPSLLISVWLGLRSEVNIVRHGLEHLGLNHQPKCLQSYGMISLLKFNCFL